MKVARKNSKAEKPPYQEAVSFILSKRGTSYDAWSKQVINDICVSVLQGENVEWRNKMLEQAAIQMLAEDVQARQIDKPANSDLQTHRN